MEPAQKKRMIDLTLILKSRMDTYNQEELKIRSVITYLIFQELNKRKKTPEEMVNIIFDVAVNAELSYLETLEEQDKRNEKN